MTATAKLVRVDENWGGAVMAKSGVVVRRNRSAAGLTEAEARQLHEQIAGLAIERVATESVKSNPRNAKEHPDRQIVLIAENMRKFGVNHPA